MKKSMLVLFLFASLNLGAEAPFVAGEIHYDKESSGGTLFIFARYYEAKGGIPVAIKRIEKPQFPLKFKLSGKDAFAPGTPFKGPFKILARLSPEGDAWEADVAMAMGDSGVDTRIEVGSDNVIIKLKREVTGGKKAQKEANELNRRKKRQNAP